MDRKLIIHKSPNLILAGFGALDKMGEEAGNLEAKKALLVTDKGIIDSGVSAKVEKVLTDRKIAVDVFDQVIPDPDIACCEKCIDRAKAGRYDLIVGVGGGSAMDIASVTSALCTNPGGVALCGAFTGVKRPPLFLAASCSSPITRRAYTLTPGVCQAGLPRWRRAAPAGRA